MNGGIELHMDTEIGSEVRQRIRLNNSNNWLGSILFEDCDDGIDVLRLVCCQSLY